MPIKKARQSVTPQTQRHDAGLIQPGREVSRQRSAPSLNAHANGGTASSHAPSSPSPEVKDNSLSPPTPLLDNDGSQEMPDNHGVRTQRRDTEGSLHLTEADEELSTDTHGQSHHSNGHAIVDPSSSGTLGDSLTTIIGPQCRWDVLAILLLLLHLPPVIQIGVQATFAWMTFGNTNSSWSSLSLSGDWFRSHGGNPSIIVSLLADAVFFGLWLLLPIMKDFVLDLAPAVVAVWLGGGVAGRDTWKHATLCTGTLFFSHIFHDRRRRQYSLDILWAFMSRLSFSPAPIHTPLLILPSSAQATRSWARIVLELHIVSYGCVRIIRRWVSTPSNRSTTSNARFETDGQITQTGTSVSTDFGLDGTKAGALDGKTLTAAQNSKEKSISSGKRRRKQATFVRSQQPVWAAVADLRINVAKEMESSHAERDSFEAMARNTKHLGDATSRIVSDRAFITKIEDTEIGFRAIILRAEEKLEPPPDHERRSSLGSKVLDVSVNGAFWSSVDCVDTLANESESIQWKVDGKIFGLTPMTSYHIEFLRSGSRQVVLTTSLLTRPVASSAVKELLAPQQDAALRPSSPITTLKNSIATAELKVAERKARSTKVRKSHQHAIRSVKQDVSDLTRSLQSFSTDERQRQRQIQYKKNIEQAEESISNLQDELAQIGAIPRDDLDAFNENKRRFDEATKCNADLRKLLDASKRDAQKLVNDAQAESAKVRGKKEKLEHRLSSLNDRRKATSEDNDAKRNAKAYSESIQLYTIEQQRKQERDLLASIHGCNVQRQDLEIRIAEVQQQQRQPTIFDQPINHPFGQPALAKSENGYAYGQPRSHPGLGLKFAVPSTLPARADSFRLRSRPRSGSMLSDISGHSDEAAGVAAAGFNNGHVADIPRNTSASSGRVSGQGIGYGSSHGSGHGSRHGSGHGSQRDSNSPAPKLSPIGAEVGRNSPRLGKR